MADDSQSSDAANAENVEADQPQATVVSAETLTVSDVKPWKFENFDQKEVEASQAVRQEVIERLRKEVEPELQEQATIIKRQAFEEAQQQGFDEGFKQGVQAGKLEGRSQAEKDAETILKPQVQALRELSEFMVTPYQALSEQVLKQLTHISLAVAEKLVKVEVDRQKDWVLKAVEKAVETLPRSSSPLEIRVNADDKALLEKYTNEHEKSWILQVDESLERGSCKVHQGSSTVVNDWREQLKQLIDESFNAAETLAEESSTIETDAKPVSKNHPEEKAVSTQPVTSKEA